jgi:hypothetical protein
MTPVRIRIFIPISLGVLLMLSSVPAFGQDEGLRPPDWPDAATVVREYLAGEESFVATIALRRCPHQNPYGDTVLVALLSAPLPPSRAVQLGTRLQHVFLTCGDPRIEAWFRDHLLAATSALGAAAFLDPLVNRRTRRDVELLKQIAFDDTRDEQMRSEILRRLSDHLTWAEQSDLLLEAYSRTTRMPQPFSYNAFHALVRSPVGARFVERSFQIVQEEPQHQNAVRLLGWLASDTEVRNRPALRDRLRSALVRIERNRDGRFPRDLVESARAQLEVLGATP